jgi:hypothetical protein
LSALSRYSAIIIIVDLYARKQPSFLLGHQLDEIPFAERPTIQAKPPNTAKNQTAIQPSEWS